jgi:hypothetical protein
VTSKKSKLSEPSDLCLFKIHLRGSKPLIWRKFYTPLNITCEVFAYAALAVMGWHGGHYYSIFKKGRTEVQGFSALFFDLIDGVPDNYLVEYDDTLTDATDSLVKDYLNQKGDSVDLLYDYNCGWMHMVKLEEVNYVPKKDDGFKYGCLSGARACPPERIGGIERFNFLLALEANPETREKESYIEGDDEGKYNLPEYFDPKSFSLEISNANIRILKTK